MKENTKPKPCLECESYTTGECVSKIPCDMNYSAFKPCETKQKPGCRPEQQLNKPPVGEVDGLIRTLEAYGETDDPVSIKFYQSLCLEAKDHLTAQAKELKRLNDVDEECVGLWKKIEQLEAENRWIPVSERLPEKNTRCLVFANFKSKIPPVRIYKDVYINTYSGDGEWDVYKELIITHWKPITLPALQEKGE